MNEHKLSPDISILLDDEVFKNLYDTLVDSVKRIEIISKIIRDTENELNETLFKVAFKLLEDEAALKAFSEEADCEIVLYNSLDLRFVNQKDCSILYDISEGIDAEAVLVFDDEDMSVIGFPISYAVRADWLAKLEVYSEAIKLKKTKTIEIANAVQEVEELRILKSLMEKYKDKI